MISDYLIKKSQRNYRWDFFISNFKRFDYYSNNRINRISNNPPPPTNTIPPR